MNELMNASKHTPWEKALRTRECRILDPCQFLFTDGELFSTNFNASSVILCELGEVGSRNNIIFPQGRN